MKLGNPFTGALVALMIVIVGGAALSHFTSTPGDVRIPAVKMVPATSASAASKAAKPQRTAGVPMILDGGLISDSSQIVPPAISPLVRVVVVPKGKGCTELFKLSWQKCQELGEKAGRPAIAFNDVRGKQIIEAPRLYEGEIVYLLRDPKTGEVLPSFQRTDDSELELAVEPDKKPSR